MAESNTLIEALMARDRRIAELEDQLAALQLQCSAKDIEIANLRVQVEERKNLCGLTNAQLGRSIRNAYIEVYEDGKAGKEPVT